MMRTALFFEKIRINRSFDSSRMRREDAVCCSHMQHKEMNRDRC